MRGRLGQSWLARVPGRPALSRCRRQAQRRRRGLSASVLWRRLFETKFAPFETIWLAGRLRASQKSSGRRARNCLCVPRRLKMPHAQGKRPQRHRYRGADAGLESLSRTILSAAEDWHCLAASPKEARGVVPLSAAAAAAAS